MNALKTVIAWIRRAEAAVAVGLLGVIVGVVFLGTVMRYLGAPLIWSEELAQALFVWLALLAADLTLQHAGHFRIDMLINFLPPALQTALDILIKLMIVALLAALAYYGLHLIRVSHPRPLPMLDVPSSLATAALPVAFVLMLITTIEQIVRRLRGEHDTPTETREVM
jgi:TRAP-type transport system small permease protein